jgi:outer membrane protein OmpA-like peptidoglycan-associated protein
LWWINAEVSIYGLYYSDRNDSINVSDSLSYLAQIVIENPTLVVELTGNCDLYIRERKNNRCGFERARAVKEFLVEKGISPKRLVLASN